MALRAASPMNLLPVISTLGALVVRTAVLIALALWIPASALGAKDNKPPEVDAPAKVKPGTTGLLKAGKGMRYFLRVPKRYNPATGARLIVFLHGSSMNGLSYLQSFRRRSGART